LIGEFESGTDRPLVSVKATPRQGGRSLPVDRSLPFFRILPRNPGGMCHVRMKTIFKLSVLAFLLAVAPSRAFALRSIGVLSAGDANEMGVNIRATPVGPDAAWVEMEFKVEGKLKEYRSENGPGHVELEIRDGEKLLLSYAALREQHPKPGHVLVRFMANRAFLDKLVLTIVIGDGAAAGGAYELSVKEFVDPAKIR
jgi:hypothetical protein